MDSTLSFLLQRKICHKILFAGTAVAFKNMHFLFAVFMCIEKYDK